MNISPVNSSFYSSSIQPVEKAPASLASTPDKPVANDPSTGRPSISSKSPSEPQASDASREQPREASLQQEISNVVSQLKARDSEVRAHEAAHLAAGGAYVTGGASFSYQTGPDGKRYAIGGEVGIDTSPIANDPEATIQKAQQIQRAALAPASPSSQDYRVAAAAMQMMMTAQVELAKQPSEQLTEGTTDSFSANNADKDAKSVQAKNSAENGLKTMEKSPGLVVRQDFELRTISQTW